MESIENTYSPNLPSQNSGKGIGWKIFFGIILGFSIIANLALIVALAASVIVFTAGKSDSFLEKALEKGPGSNKIAVIKIEGIIDNELAEDVSQQIKTAKKALFWAIIGTALLLGAWAIATAIKSFLLSL